jgi:hypothetical protein
VQTARPEEKLARCEVKCCCPLPWRRSGSLRFPLAQRRQLESGGGRGIVDLYIYIYMCTKNLAGGCDVEAAFVESRIQGLLQILPAR